MNDARCAVVVEIGLAAEEWLREVRVQGDAGTA